MSTNKTQNYQLHSWEPDDDFLRQEFNENFAKLDEKARVVVGTYMGNDSYNPPQEIYLGFRPRAVLVNCGAAMFRTDHTSLATLAVDGADVGTRLVITDNGFRVTSGLNRKDGTDSTSQDYPFNPFRYIAVP